MIEPVGPFVPDMAALNPGVAMVAKNVIPAQASYRPFPAFAAVSGAITGRVQGAMSARESASGQIYNFSGDDKNIYKLDSAGITWSDVSRTVGGDYATSPDGFWTFSQFGDYIIACNGVDDNQFYDLGTSTEFDALAGSPPGAKYSAIIRDFVVLGGIGTNQNRVHWSGINAPDDYVPSATTMSDYQDFPEGGRVQGIAGGDVGIVFCERAIYRMAFEGPPLIFRFDKIATSLGCRAPRSIASYEGLTFFLAYDGLYMIRGASELVPIGSEKVDRWFFDNVDLSKVDRITGAIDPNNKIYILGFVSPGSSVADKALIYHWPTGKFSYAEFEHEMLYSASRQEGVTIDGLDAVAATIDELPFTIDSLFYSGVGQIDLAAFNDSYRMGFFDGANMEATVETGDFQLTPGRKSLLRGVRPIVEGAFSAPSVVVLYRDLAHETLSSTAASAATSTGFCNTRVNARYHRGRIVVPNGADWSHIVGIDDVKFSAMGAR